MRAGVMSKGDTGVVAATKFDMEKSSSDIVVQGSHNDIEVVADKWQGNASDRHDMLMLGRAQVLRV